MTPFLLSLLVDPETKEPLTVEADQVSGERIMSGTLQTASGRKYPIINGIPRFAGSIRNPSVESFGDEWNHFNFTDFREQWLQHTVKNTFGSTEAFQDRVIVDAGGGSGAQSKWMLESGARHVILLDLSHSVDDVVLRNIDRTEHPNFDVVQCSIDAPPLRPGGVDGIVICHNVIQHTESVPRTAAALFGLTAPGGEFVFNCYQLNDRGAFRWARWHLIYVPMRKLLSRLPFRALLAYSYVMAALRLVPGLGYILEKLILCAQGDVPRIASETVFGRLRRRFQATSLNTFDAFGSHHFQHHLSDEEIDCLALSLQPDERKILNREPYFRRPQPIGCALRVQH